MKLAIITAITIGTLTGCASITNDACVPMALSFSDGSTGSCDIKNKRFPATVEIPGTPMVRRSDDNLRIKCKTTDGREATASVPSTIGTKIVASAVFLDFGITDSITDKHREYRQALSYLVKPKNKEDRYEKAGT